MVRLSPGLVYRPGEARCKAQGSKLILRDANAMPCIALHSKLHSVQSQSVWNYRLDSRTEFVSREWMPKGWSARPRLAKV